MRARRREQKAARKEQKYRAWKQGMEAKSQAANTKNQPALEQNPAQKSAPETTKNRRSVGIVLPISPSVDQSNAKIETMKRIYSQL
jgi:hypothetical protein